MLHELKHVHTKARIMPLRLTVSSSTVTNLQGKEDLKSATASSNAITLTYQYAFARTPVVITCVEAGLAGGYATVASNSGTGCIVTVRDSAGTAAAGTVHIWVFGWDSKFTQTLPWQKQQVVSTIPACRLELFRVTAGVTPVIAQHKTRGLVSRNGTGDYTVSFTDPFGSASLVCGGTAVGSTFATVQPHTLAANSVRVKTFDASAAAADADFWLWVIGSASNFMYGLNRNRIRVYQNSSRIHAYKMAWTTGTPAVSIGDFSTTVADTGTGVATIGYGGLGFNFKRVPLVLASGAKATVDLPTVSEMVVRAFDAGGSAADVSTTIDLLVFGTDDTSEY